MKELYQIKWEAYLNEDILNELSMEASSLAYIIRKFLEKYGYEGDMADASFIARIVTDELKMDFEKIDTVEKPTGSNMAKIIMNMDEEFLKLWDLAINASTIDFKRDDPDTIQSNFVNYLRDDIGEKTIG